MPLLLIANRGEVAVRVARAAADLGLLSVAVYATDDAGAGHLGSADRSVALPGAGPAAYLDIDALMAAASDCGATHLHPGWGFRSEDPDLARACAAAGVTFVGPSPEVLELLGDKAAARRLATRLGVAVPEGSDGPMDAATAAGLLADLGPGAAVMLKAVAGGGGRGMRAVSDPADMADAHARATSEARAAFGRGDLYVERLIRRARHIEVQVAGDAAGSVRHLRERECTLQRRHQKLVEVAPAPDLDPALRDGLWDAALRLAGAVGLVGLATVEFLVDLDAGPDDEPAVFIEANARLQVEHTVTEELLGVDLVVAQLLLADGASLDQAGLGVLPADPAGYAVQARVTTEAVGPDGAWWAAAGTLRALDLPTGPGVRVDTAASTGTTVNPRYDPLLAKVVVRSRAPSWAAAAARTARVLGRLHVDGVVTTTGLLRAVLTHPDVVAGRSTTAWVDDHAADLAAAGVALTPTPPDRLADAPSVDGDPAAGPAPTGEVPADEVLAEGVLAVTAPMAGVVVEVAVAAGDRVGPGSTVVVLDAMKMEHLLPAGVAGTVVAVVVGPGDTVVAGSVVATVAAADLEPDPVDAADAIDPDLVRADLAEVRRRRSLLDDASRPERVGRRHGTGHRTAREHVADLCDPDSFEEYGGFAVAAQTSRRSLDDLRTNTPADGLITGIGRVNGDRFDDAAARCAVLSYDYTVLAGTQGWRNHAKKDRILDVIERLRLPVVFFTEGGGGRPGDTDFPVVAGLDTPSFARYAGLSGLVPLVGVVAGRCFAGNAALLGCSDVIIATADSSIGMGGPAMIEGGGLGVFHPDEVGPVSVQAANGVIDVVVADDVEAADVARRYLSYFQGPVATWACGDQRLLRHLVPESRVRAYDTRRVIDTLADTGSVLELRPGFGVGIRTALARIEGRPVGVVANNPQHLGGAIDTPAADKAARFLQLCDAFDVPVVFLCDTPGFMVGPDAETTAQVRHFSRLFVTGASLTVPTVTVVLRKGYGLGAQAMAGGSLHRPLLTVSWPTGEFGGMGLEGAVRLGFRRELDAIADPDEREALYAKLVAAAYERGKALSMATSLEIDDVIDPADTRRRIMAVLRAAPPAPARTGKKRPLVDTW